MSEVRGQMEVGSGNAECGKLGYEHAAKGREAERFGSGEGGKIEVEKMRRWEAER